MKVTIEQLAGIDGIREVLSKARAGSSKAYARAANRAAQGMKTDALKGISKNYTAKRGKVAEKIFVKRATESDPSAEIYAKGRRVRSIYFKHRKNTRPGKRGGKPVFLQVKKGAGGLLSGSGGMSKAFIANMPHAKGSATSIVQRMLTSDGKTQKTGTGKDSMKAVFSPAIAQMLDHPEIKEAIRTGAVERFNKEFDHQLSRELQAVLKGGADLR